MPPEELGQRIASYRPAMRPWRGWIVVGSIFGGLETSFLAHSVAHSAVYAFVTAIGTFALCFAAAWGATYAMQHFNRVHVHQHGLVGLTSTGKRGNLSWVQINDVRFAETRHGLMIEIGSRDNAPSLILPAPVHRMNEFAGTIGSVVGPHHALSRFLNENVP
jgi:hypothetical protein